MNNYYTLIHLAGEFQRYLTGSMFTNAVSFRKHRLELYFEFPDSSNCTQLTFSCDPKRICLFGSNYFPPKKKDVVTFFRPLEGSFVEDIRLADKDRLLDLQFDNSLGLRFKLFGHGANCFLYDENANISESFRGGEKYIGAPLPEPGAPKIKSAEELSGDVGQKLVQRDPKLPRGRLNELTRIHQLDEQTDEDIAGFADRLSSVLYEDAVPSVIGEEELCIFPREWLPVERTDYESFDAAVRAVFSSQLRNERLNESKKWLEQLFSGEVKRLKSRVTEAENAVKALERAEEYEQYAHILMTHPRPQSIPDSDELVMEDPFNPGKDIAIPVKAGLSIIENANAYYEKTGDARKSAKVTESMGLQAREKLEEAEAALEKLQSITGYDKLREFEQQNRQMIDNLAATAGPREQARPFNVTAIEGYEVWIGRNAKSNDALIRSSHKEDVWFHARSVTGSHVLIRMGGQKKWPPKSAMEKAASVAAWHSKASGDSLTPVQYTKCKHLRKPKSASPGKVNVEREEVMMAEPGPLEKTEA